MHTAATLILRLATPSFCTSSCWIGCRALAHRRRTRSSVSSPESVVRSMQVMARSSHAACHSFFTVRRVTSVCARRSTALVFTRTASIQSRFSGMPRLGCSSRPAYCAIAVSEGEIAPGAETESELSLESRIAGGLSRRVMESLHRIGEITSMLHLITLLELVYRREPRFCHSFSNSARLQNDFCVPTFVVESAA